MADTLESFYFKSAAARGCAVRLENSWRSVLARRPYPEPVRKMLGEVVAGSVMLGSSISFDGPMVMQVAGDGPVRLVMAEVRPDLSFRAVARLEEDQTVEPGASFTDIVNKAGKGRCALTLLNPDPARRSESYQGIVPLAGSSSMCEALASYMTHSEQVDTLMLLASDNKAACGLMVQRIASGGGNDGADDPDAWNRISTLFATATREELLALPPKDILTRLFWQENPVMAPPRTPSFRCTCGRDRVAELIVSLGEDEARGIVRERGGIQVVCEFCGKAHFFDPIDVEELFNKKFVKGSETLQ